MFSMFVVDLLHEVELGVWRSLFIHLLRILECIKPTLTHTLDERFVFFECLIVRRLICFKGIGKSLHLGVTLFESFQVILQK